MAVNAEVFLPRFFISVFKKTLTQVTTLPRQNNQIHFGFGKSILISCLSGRYTYVLRNQDTVVVMKGM